MIRLAAWAYGFLAFAFLLVMFTTSSYALLIASMFIVALCIGRCLRLLDRHKKPEPFKA